ncbi:P-loop containing nucleoside triphosphate hydrolase protein [Schizothecium vesticola]|uniref:P-loop containing nucleoside triphosphate hydrolase protein n=1 Tax=Schizothecium vesticola TaxID=314040 RepID=A0AA40BRB3_9PEZI|nr:P-loop containing nucleoside triphosphate hydrolase protein [Schizothecium vesticola]
MFDYWIASPLREPRSAPEGLRRLQKLVAATCLRRTKDSIVQTGTLLLPTRQDRVEYVGLGQEDRTMYDFFRDRAAAMLSGLLLSTEARRDEQQVPGGSLLRLINILRRICDHGEMLLPPADVRLYRDRQDPISESGLCGEQEEEDDGECQSSPSRVDIVPSAKVTRLIDNIRREQQANSTVPSQTPVKSVVFSYWTGMLDLIEPPLRKAGFSFRRIDGQGSLRHRAEVLSAFSEDPSCTVLLASLGSAGEGLDLTAGNCVHLMEPHWNPTAEAQPGARPGAQAGTAARCRDDPVYC